MQLSKEKPTRTGHYWYQPPGKPHEMVEVKQFGDGSLTVYAAAWWGDTVDRCDGLFSARIPEPCAKPEGTVRVRVAVAVSDKSDWNSCGWKNCPNDQEAISMALETLDYLGSQVVHWLEADVPLPSPTTIPAEVQNAE